MPTEDTQAFATSFAQLASSILSQKSPALLDKMLGFQVLDTNEENSRAIGFFGFDLNGQLCYAPVFFLRGEIKGTDLLYYKDKDLFLPLTDGWINFIETKRNVGLGFGTDESPLEMGISAPDLSSASPFGFSNKISSYIPSWAVGGLQMFQPRDPYTDKRYSKIASFTDALKETNTQVGYEFLNKITEHYKVASFLLENYEDDTLANAVRYNRSKVAHLNPVAEQATVEFIDRGYDKLASLGEGEKAKVIRGEIVVKDNRDPTKLATVLENSPKLYSTVTEPCFCEVLFKDGEFSDALVLHQQEVSSGRGKDNKYIVIKPNPEKVTCARGSNIVKRCEDKHYLNKDELAEKIKSYGSSPKDLKNNDIVVFADYLGNATKPRRIIGVTSSESGICYEVTTDGWDSLVDSKDKDPKKDHFRQEAYERKGYPTPALDCDYDINYTHGQDEYSPKKVLVTDKKVDGLVNVGKKLLMNADCCVAIKLDKYEGYSYNDTNVISDITDAKEKREYAVGCLADVESSMNKEASYDKVKVYHSNGSYEILGNHVRKLGLNKMAALNVLAKELTIQGDKALEIVKKAQDNTTCRFHMIKRAAPGIAAPYFDPNSGVMAISPESTQEIEPTPHVPFEETPDLDFAGSFQDKINLMNQAAQSGEKDIFDAAALGSLISVNDPSEEINKYVSDLILSIDRLGRILFLLYWHYDEFAERYENEDLIHLEDNLINNFSNLGELSYDLQQRAIVDNPTIQGLSLA